MDFSLGAEVEAFRQEVRDFLEPWTEMKNGVRRFRGGDALDDEVHRAMAARGWLELQEENNPLWSMKMFVLSEEAAALDFPMTGLSTTMMVGFTLMKAGTEAQKAEILPRIAAGEVRICLGYSEPGAGSDIAGTKTKAEQDGDDWIVNGQKQWTSYARTAEYIWLLTRSDSDARKHAGLTVFLVPMNLPGIRVVPIPTIGGENPNQVFFDSVRVPRECLVGEPHQGWQVLTQALTYEHGGGNVPGRSLNGILRRELELGLALLADHDPATLDSSVPERLGAIAAELEILRLLNFRTMWIGAHVAKADVPGSVSKIFGREAAVRASGHLVDIAGTNALANEADDAADWISSAIQHEYVATPVGTVVGGSVEIQRTILAERGLGLPRPKRG